MSFGKAATGDLFQNNENPMEFMQFTVRPPPLPITSLSSTSRNSEINWAQLAQQWIQMRDKNTIETCEQKKDNGYGNILGPLDGEKGEADMEMEDDEQPDVMPLITTKHELLQVPCMTHQPPPSVPNMSQLWYMQQYSGGSLPPGLSWNNEWPKSNLPSFPPMSGSNVLKNKAISVPLPPPIPLQIPINRLDNSKNIPAMNTAVGLMPDFHADESKRKILPAWLREGLEKMEKNKQKQQQQESAVKNTLSKSSFEETNLDLPISNNLTRKSKAINSDNENECLGNVKQHINYIDIEKKSIAILLRHKDKDGGDNGISDGNGSAEDTMNAAINSNRSYTELVAIEGKNIEQNPLDLIQAVRRILTELLLEVTNNIIAEVVHETHRQMRLKGLAAYEDSSSDKEDDANYTSESSGGDRKQQNHDENDDTENELLRTIRDKKAEFALFIKNKKIELLHEENDQGEVTSNRDNVHKKTSSSSAHKDVVERTPMKTILLPVCNETKGLRNVECSYKIIGERSDTKIQHNNEKYRKGYSSRRKERTTRFSDNRDGMSLPISVIPSQIMDKVAMNGVCVKSFSSAGLTEDSLQNDIISNFSKIKSTVTSTGDNIRNNKTSNHRGVTNANYSSSALSSASDLETNISASLSSRHYSTRSTLSKRRKSYKQSYGRQTYRDRKSEKKDSSKSHQSYNRKKTCRHQNYSSNSDNDQEIQKQRKSRHRHRTSSRRPSSPQYRSRSSNVAKKSWY